MDDCATPTTDARSDGSRGRSVWSGVMHVECVETNAEDCRGLTRQQVRPDSSGGVWLRLVALLFVLAAAGLLAIVVDLSSGGALLQPARGAGLVGAGAFVLVFAGGTLGPFPRNVLSTVAGTIFGFWWGLPLAYLGSLLGAGGRSGWHVDSGKTPSGGSAAHA